jgi:hypothetical protein
VKWELTATIASGRNIYGSAAMPGIMMSARFDEYSTICFYFCNMKKSAPKKRSRLKNNMIANK